MSARTDQSNALPFNLKIVTAILSGRLHRKEAARRVQMLLENVPRLNHVSSRRGDATYLPSVESGEFGVPRIIKLSFNTPSKKRAEFLVARNPLFKTVASDCVQPVIEPEVSSLNFPTTTV